LAAADPPDVLAIRAAVAADFPAVLDLFQRVVASGDTYAYYSPGTSLEQARRWGLDPPDLPFVAEDDGRIVGTYSLKPNQPGLGDHVAHCGCMTEPEFRGRGVAGTMCVHSRATARSAGFSAMQFNFVVASNTGAIRLWQRHGFAIVGRVPAAFRHALQRPTDVLVMHRPL
jgi:ribosomal protein S18 acetylase RimI-like enzyme